MIDELQELIKNSYAPYSNMHFACIVETKSGNFYKGVNVENASYGACICAERTAACKGVSEGYRNFKAIAVAAKEKKQIKEAWPCGICRQFLYEFNKDLDVITGSSREKLQVVKLSELLSMGFSLREK